MPETCFITECDTKPRSLSLCIKHYRQIIGLGHLLTPEEIHEIRSKCTTGRANNKGKSWKVKDTSNMRGRVPRSAFKKGHSTWNTGLKDWQTQEHKNAVLKASTKYTDEEKATNKVLRMRTKKLRNLVLARDNDLCQVCLSTSQYLQVDHIKSWAEYPELRFDLDNLRTLCMPCHYYITYKKKLTPGKLWGHSQRRTI